MSLERQPAYKDSAISHDFPPFDSGQTGHSSTSSIVVGGTQIEGAIACSYDKKNGKLAVLAKSSFRLPSHVTVFLCLILSGYPLYQIRETIKEIYRPTTSEPSPANPNTTPSTIPPTQTPIAPSNRGGFYAIQVNSFQKSEQADARVSELKGKKEINELNLEVYSSKTNVPGRGVWYRVLIRPQANDKVFANKTEAGTSQSKLLSAGVISRDSLLTDEGVPH